MNRILVIDDVTAYHAVLSDAIKAAFGSVECACEPDFDRAIERVRDEEPDAIVLDLMEGQQSVNLPGQRTWQAVWNASFCPVVIYTGTDADLIPPVQDDHPFVKRIRKRSGGEAHVVEALKSFAPAIQALRELRNETREVLGAVLRDTAGAGHFGADAIPHLVHASRRRIAATMDSETITGNRPMASWEQYLIPAMGKSPLTADVLRRRDTQWSDPTAFRLVLTPSCDMVLGRCEKTLIAACCESTDRLAKRLSLSSKRSRFEDNVDKVKSRSLTPGAFEGFLPLPAFPSRIPLMAAYLKDIEVIPWSSVGPEGSSTHAYVRIASIDSPFREQVAWAYLTTAARPGMPERDLKPWAEEIVKAANEGQSGESTGGACATRA